MGGGLPALGSAYGGEFESMLGPYAVAAELARKRLDKAKLLAKERAQSVCREIVALAPVSTNNIATHA